MSSPSAQSNLDNVENVKFVTLCVILHIPSQNKFHVLSNNCLSSLLAIFINIIIIRSLYVLISINLYENHTVVYSMIIMITNLIDI